jgi:hypothetical protein
MADPTPAPSPPDAASVGSFITTSSHDGRVVVASDALLAQLDSLGTLAENARLCAGALLGVVESVEPRASLANAVPTAALDAGRVIRSAVATLLTAEDRARRIASAVLSCLAEYGQTEQLARAVVHGVDESAAWIVGAGARLFGLPFGLAAVSGILAGCAITRTSPATLAEELQAYLKVHGRILTNPRTVAIIRELASDADGIGSGFMLVPPPLAAALDSSRLTGVSSSANAVVALGRGVGLFEPSGAAVRKTSSFEFGTPATSLAARAGSFPDPHVDPNGEQIRIDRYVEAGKPDRFDVYIAGTVTFDPVTRGQPFDLASDLEGVGGKRSASYGAVVAAMRDAGITPESPVVLNGHSQGGLLASQIAASGGFNVHGVVTFGAPSAQVQIPASIPMLTVRNAEDLVPATSGYDVNPNAIVVERPVFAATPVPSDWAVPAHRLSYYQETAAVVDRAGSSEVRGVLDLLNQFGAGADRVDSTLWVATRVPAPTAARN